MTSEQKQTNNPETIVDFQEALDTLASKRERPMLYVCGGMDYDTYEKIRDLATLKLEGFSQLSVLLSSHGGHIEPAYKMVLALRRYMNDIEVLVPGWAKSAATLFCLGADTVYMGVDGELGPLDPQIIDRSGSARPISSLESFKALEQLLRHSLESFDSIVQLLLQRAHMDVPHAINHAKPLFAAIVSPLYQQIDPHELGEAGRYLAEGEEYAIRTMRRWGYPYKSDIDVQDIAHRLVWNYPSHGFVIDLNEAQSMGLNVKELDDESDKVSKFILENAGENIGIGFPHPQSICCDIEDTECQNSDNVEGDNDTVA